MTLKGQGRVYTPKNSGPMIYVPSGVGNDSAFPFKEGEKIEVEIKERELVVKRTRD